MEPILEIRGLRKEFNDFTLKDIDLTLDRGYIMGFIGPNGAGKSTTIKLIMNLLKKDRGEIKIFGKDNVRCEREVKDKIGFVFDENYFYDELTVSEMKWVLSKFYRSWDESAYERYLRQLEVPKNRKIKELSKGNKMKFSLTVALSHNAELLLMDEPTSGLDPLTRSELLDILAELIQDENKSVFFSTHITSDLDKIADYVTLIHQGEIVLSAAKEDITNDYAIVKGRKEILNCDACNDFIGVKVNQYGFTALSKRLKNRNFGEGVVVEKPTLEDIMLHYTKGGNGSV